MGSSPTDAQLRNPIYPSDRFGVSFEVENKPYEDAIKWASDNGVLGMIGIGAGGQIMNSLVSSQNETEKKKAILNGVMREM